MFGMVNFAVVSLFPSLPWPGDRAFRVKLPPAHLSTTRGGSFTLSFLMLNVKQGSCEHELFVPDVFLL